MHCFLFSAPKSTPRAGSDFRKFLFLDFTGARQLSSTEFCPRPQHPALPTQDSISRIQDPRQMVRMWRFRYRSLASSRSRSRSLSWSLSRSRSRSWFRSRPRSRFRSRPSPGSGPGLGPRCHKNVAKICRIFLGIFTFCDVLWCKQYFRKKIFFSQKNVSHIMSQRNSDFSMKYVFCIFSGVLLSMLSIVDICKRHFFRMKKMCQENVT